MSGPYYPKSMTFVTKDVANSPERFYRDMVQTYRGVSMDAQNAKVLPMQTGVPRAPRAVVSTPLVVSGVTFEGMGYIEVMEGMWVKRVW